MKKINFANNSELYLSAENLNQMQDNIEEAIEEHYSLEEQFAGKYWIDGKKIYRKVVLIGDTTLSNTTATYKHKINNIKEVTDINFRFYFDYAWYTDWESLKFKKANETNISISTNDSLSVSGLLFILEYTKTTD